VGFELTAAELFPVRGGVLFEQSSAPKVEEMSPIYMRERVHTLGGALSFGVRSRNYDVSIGATGLYGVGEGLGAVVGEAGQAPSYRTTDVREATLLVFVTGARQAVRQIAESITSDKPQRKR
jgi:hypothetical protein